jgi:hypothetical protein
VVGGVDDLDGRTFDLSIVRLGVADKLRLTPARPLRNVERLLLLFDLLQGFVRLDLAAGLLMIGLLNWFRVGELALLLDVVAVG